MILTEILIFLSEIGVVLWALKQLAFYCEFAAELHHEPNRVITSMIPYGSLMQSAVANIISNVALLGGAVLLNLILWDKVVCAEVIVYAVLMLGSLVFARFMSNGVLDSLKTIVVNTERAMDLDDDVKYMYLRLRDMKHTEFIGAIQTVLLIVVYCALT